MELVEIGGEWKTLVVESVCGGVGGSLVLIRFSVGNRKHAVRWRWLFV